jgi:HemY protein
LSLASQSWDAAQSYFESSLKLSKKPETCAELGRLLARVGEPERSIEYFQLGLQAAGSSALSPLPMPAASSPALTAPEAKPLAG